MENKSNDATPQRPDGERILNAPLVQMQVMDAIEQIKGESTWEESDRNSIVLFKSDSLRIVLIGLHANAALKPHKANGVISVQVMKGKMQFTAMDEVVVMEVGQMIALQANIVHSVQAIEDSFFLLTLAMDGK